MAQNRFLIIVTLAVLAACGKAHPEAANAAPTTIESAATTIESTATTSVDNLSTAATAEASNSTDSPRATYTTSSVIQSPVPTEVYGALVVREGTFNVESPNKPWSSWWFPVYETTLFQTPNGFSPLEKYDRVAYRILHHDTDAAAWARNSYEPRAANWAGLCDAWAIASIMVTEPKPVRYRGVDFSTMDVKALTLLTYQNVEGLRYFGKRNDNKWDDDYADIYPDQFHRFLQAELFEKKLPFIMDINADHEVWNTPIWKASIKIARDPSDASVMHVHTWLWGASPHVNDMNHVGTLERVFEYTYDLRGSFRDDGSFIVQSGAWTDRSRWDHPDYVIAKPASVKRQSLNPQIDVRVVDEILRSMDPMRMQLGLALYLF